MLLEREVSPKPAGSRIGTTQFSLRSTLCGYLFEKYKSLHEYGDYLAI
jgi:hypothetical protein